jgi:hypothetical protein
MGKFAGLHRSRHSGEIKDETLFEQRVGVLRPVLLLHELIAAVVRNLVDCLPLMAHKCKITSFQGCEAIHAICEFKTNVNLM